ncbi:acetyltransferase [Frondihabitans sucicola]|uniref:Acetyltransferase n=1 Tax=Frondihabitans sucicola TaxID=1268041 RepID=A0ABM8GQS7_9MICO|nr:GNAT family protein [Frondihabitans sucicola]BDZ50659.1 acetyltransferase [Frondihabitans sucicola]
METVNLATDRLLLRPPIDGDVDAVYLACQDLELQRRVPVPVPYTREAAASFVHDHARRGWESGTVVTWALERDGVFAGVVALDVHAGRRGSIGFWLAPEHRGVGLVLEASRAAIDFAFAPQPNGLGLVRVEWRAFSGNFASARVAQRLGFRFEGIARLGAVGRAGLEDDWIAGRLATDDPAPRPWPVLPA